MPKHSKQQVARFFHFGAEKADRFCQGLVNGLVKANEVVHGRDVVRAETVCSEAGINNDRYEAVAMCRNAPMCRH
jgi:hypothetical protein